MSKVVGRIDYADVEEEGGKAMADPGCENELKTLTDDKREAYEWHRSA